MKVFLSKPGCKYLLLTLDSENKAEAQILIEMANTVPVLHLTTKGSTVEVEVGIQYIETTLKKDDIESLISYASNNDQMADEDFEQLKQIKGRMKELGLYHE